MAVVFPPISPHTLLMSLSVLLAAAFAAPAAALGHIDFKSPSSASFSDAEPAPLQAPILAADEQSPSADAPDPDFHCRPDVIAAFDRLYTQSEALNETAGGRAIELVVQIVPNEGAFDFIFSDPPGENEDSCRRVRLAPGAVSRAHNHPPNTFPEPSGVDCDSPVPNYILSPDGIYATNARAPNERLYGSTGEPRDLGTYRKIYSGDNWRTRRNRPDWEDACRSEAARLYRRRRYSRGFPRCIRNHATEKEIREGRPLCR